MCAFVLNCGISSRWCILARMKPSLPSWPHTAAADSVTSFTALREEIKSYEGVKRIKPFRWLCMAGELGRDVGDLLKAKDLGGGEAACEGGLLHLPGSPADQGEQWCRRQIELGGDPWPEGVVTKLPPTPQLQHLVDGKLPLRDDGAGQQGEYQSLWMFSRRMWWHLSPSLVSSSGSSDLSRL